MNNKDLNIKSESVELWDVLDKDGNLTGDTQKRGWLTDCHYHLMVHVWIINKKKEFLVQKRTENKRWPNMWACTIGSAVRGDSSLTTAIKEVREELGINLDTESGKLFKRYRRDFADGTGEFIDVWVFNDETDISKVVLQADEACDAIWATKDRIREMMDEGTFLSLKDEECPYLDELFLIS